jgi:hypothetical protein
MSFVVHQGTITRLLCQYDASENPAMAAAFEADGTFSRQAFFLCVNVMPVTSIGCVTGYIAHQAVRDVSPFQSPSRRQAPEGNL